jgi:hypothetical protein
MEGTAKPQVNPEEMLAELKQALESSTRAPNAPPSPASAAAKSGSEGRKPRPSHWGVDLPAKANAGRPLGPRADLQKPMRPSSRRGKLRAGGLALGGAAAFFAGVALMSLFLNGPAHEFSAATTEGPAGPQNEQSLEPSSSAHAPAQESQQAAPLQAGALETRPDAGATSAIGGSLPAPGKAETDARHLAAFGLESSAPAFAPTPLDQAPALAPAIRIGPDGAPIITAPSTPASTDSAHPAEAPKPAPAPAAPQMAKPDGARVATAPPLPASTGSTPPIETPKPAAAPPASQPVKPDGAPSATASLPAASTASAPPAETPKPATAPTAPQMVKPEEPPIATPPPAPASAPAAETAKPRATPTASASNESTEPSTRKIDSKKKPVERASLQKPLGSPTPPIKPIARAERQPTEPILPKQAERSPQPAQGAGNPAPVAPPASPSVQQRVADGVTHAFGYLVHLPGALVPHLGGSNPTAQ